MCAFHNTHAQWQTQKNEEEEEEVYKKGHFMIVEIVIIDAILFRYILMFFPAFVC